MAQEAVVAIVPPVKRDSAELQPRALKEAGRLR
jgi:hypothetical protein